MDKQLTFSESIDITIETKYLCESRLMQGILKKAAMMQAWQWLFAL